jgi:hypothetical protein
MHDGDLSGRPAETDEAELRQNAKACQKPAGAGGALASAALAGSFLVSWMG